MMTEFQSKPVLNVSLPKTSGDHIHWGNLQGASLALAICETYTRAGGLQVIITPDNLMASQLGEEIKFFLGNESSIPLHVFPDRETLPYDNFSPHQDIISERIEILYRLPSLTQGIIIIAIPTLMHRLTPSKFLEDKTFIINLKDKLVIEVFRNRLAHAGYYHVSQVMEHGEFSIRGSIIDIFPMGAKYPYRIDLFDDEVESIRVFDPEDQRSREKITAIRLLPAKEFPLDETAITRFRQNWRTHFSGNPVLSPIYQNISQGVNQAGIEYYLPLFFDATETFFDYLPAQTTLIKVESYQTAAQNFWNEINERFKQLSYDIHKPLLPPKQLFLPEDELFAALKPFASIQTHETVIENKVGRFNFNVQTPPQLPIERRAKEPLKNLQDFLAHHHQRILFCALSAGRREAMLELLNSISFHPKFYSSWQDFIQDDSQFGIIEASLSRGLSTEEICIITESQLFGEQVYQARRREGKYAHLADNAIRDLIELNIGDAIVHTEYGIGRYQGLQNITVANEENEFLVIAYAGSDKIYVPVSSLHLISRYSGPDMDQVPLHKLGSEQWSRAKQKAYERIRDVAAELLEIQAKRNTKLGFAYKKTAEDYANFSASFPFEETPDQQRAISETLNDMQSNKTMDRLICGDVGFGKTEVAMRASFIAAQNNKQVAVLVPTTLLAEQHYNNFKDRFANWPINVEVLSRFKSNKEQQIILEKLAAGKIDIIIGTHKLIQKNIKFHNLGLLIIDEEHRFGVRQKERIKALRSEVDILTLTATPIPRTLNMAMAGIRDLSIIATPPARRLSVKSFVMEKQNAIIHEAISREVFRGGQIYFLHNSVDTIEKRAEELRTIVPEIKCSIAHGQMREKELEKVMTDFYHHRFNMLVATTIIESGIDIPTANTIIIDDADKFGLAQLHQLRGRVGRSHHQAYAYLLIGNRKLISKDAHKRLDAITAHDELGAGFILATQDLEIRGAGELLGEEQSGHMQAIGFSLYMELLEKAVNSLKSGQTLDFDSAFQQETEIELNIPALIPDTYVADVAMRLILYKRIASAENAEQLKDLQIEMIDRFGLFPKQVKNLFAIAELKLYAANLGIKKLEANLKAGKIYFKAKPNIDPQHLIKLIQMHSQRYKLDGADKLKILFNEDILQDHLIEAVKKILEQLAGHK